MTVDSFSSSANQVLSTMFPRNQNYNSLSLTLQGSRSTIKVLKTWTHIVRPFDNFSTQYQAAYAAAGGGGATAVGLGEYAAGAIGGEKIIQRRKVFTFNKPLFLNTSATGAAPTFAGTFTPQFMLMYYCDFEDVNSWTTTPAGSANPRISASMRIHYMDV